MNFIADFMLGLWILFTYGGFIVVLCWERDDAWAVNTYFLMSILATVAMLKRIGAV